MKIEWQAGPRSTGNSTGGRRTVNPICRRVRSGTRFTLDNAIPTGHQSVLADLIPFGSTISAERYFIERPCSNSRFFSSFFVSIFARCLVASRFDVCGVTLVNIEVRKEDVMAFMFMSRVFWFYKRIARFSLYRSKFCEILKGVFLKIFKIE